MTERPIILLDLNYTLAANSGEVIDGGRFYNVAAEKYRPWLRDLIADFYVILITVRPSSYRTKTLKRIAAELNWQPNEAYFNEWGYRAPKCKQTVIEHRVFPRHGRPDTTWYLALESNDETAAMYATYGIKRRRARDVQHAPGFLLERPLANAKLF